MTYQPPDPYQPLQPQSPAQVPYSPGPYPPAYQQQAYPQPIVVTQPPTSGWAVATLVLGITGLALGWCLLGIPCILAIVFGHMALNDLKTNQQSGRGMAIAGLVMGYVGVVPGVILFVAWTIGNFTT